jgi:hypothetical protein
MKRRAVRALAAWFCVATCLFSGMVPSGGFLLCFGLDGHFDIGSIAAGCSDCGDDAPPSGGSPEAQLGGATSCCPCLDVPVLTRGELARQGLTRFSGDHPAPLAASIPALVTHHEMLRRHLDPRPMPPDARSSTLSQLRSVILLI